MNFVMYRKDNAVETSGINKAAKHPRSDVTQYILKIYNEHSKEAHASVMDLDLLTERYLLHGPAHSRSNPFPSERDFIASLIWLHKMGILYISVDNKVSAYLNDIHPSKLSTPKLYTSVQLIVAAIVIGASSPVFRYI